MPADAVYVAVVDPGVGSERRSIAVRDGVGRAPGRARQRRAVPGVGGARRRRGGGRDRVRAVVLQPVSDTFHGRDVFAPAAAHLAAGVPLDARRPGHRPSRAARAWSCPGRWWRPGAIGARVIGGRRVRQRPAERRGRATWRPPASRPLLTVGGSVVPLVGIFADLPERRRSAAIVDSQGQLALVVNKGSAAETLGAPRRARCVVERDDAAAGRQGPGLQRTGSASWPGARGAASSCGPGNARRDRRTARSRPRPRAGTARSG